VWFYRYSRSSWILGCITRPTTQTPTRRWISASWATMYQQAQVFLRVQVGRVGVQHLDDAFRFLYMRVLGGNPPMVRGPSAEHNEVAHITASDRLRLSSGLESHAASREGSAALNKGAPPQ
jgi:hypothetical protein